jgi:hypothetical protein
MSCIKGGSCRTFAHFNGAHPVASHDDVRVRRPDGSRHWRSGREGRAQYEGAHDVNHCSRDRMLLMQVSVVRFLRCRCDLHGDRECDGRIFGR